jgi:hypothetical protein
VPQCAYNDYICSRLHDKQILKPGIEYSYIKIIQEPPMVIEQQLNEINAIHNNTTFNISQKEDEINNVYKIQEDIFNKLETAYEKEILEQLKDTHACWKPLKRG